jgi:hypothetical protein
MTYKKIVYSNIYYIIYINKESLNPSRAAVPCAAARGRRGGSRCDSACTTALRRGPSHTRTPVVLAVLENNMPCKGTGFVRWLSALGTRVFGARAGACFVGWPFLIQLCTHLREAHAFASEAVRGRAVGVAPPALVPVAPERVAPLSWGDERDER